MKGKRRSARSIRDGDRYILNAAAIDVGATMHMAAVGPD